MNATVDMTALIDEDDLGNAVDGYMYANNLNFNSQYAYLADGNHGVDDIADALFDAGDEWTMETAISELCD